jgi:hypothetical protein
VSLFATASIEGPALETEIKLLGILDMELLQMLSITALEAWNSQVGFGNLGIVTVGSDSHQAL